MSGKVDYKTVFGKEFMTPNDVKEANIALDKYIQIEKEAINSKK